MKFVDKTKLDWRLIMYWNVFEFLECILVYGNLGHAIILHDIIIWRYSILDYQMDLQIDWWELFHFTLNVLHFGKYSRYTSLSVYGCIWGEGGYATKDSVEFIICLRNFSNWPDFSLYMSHISCHCHTLPTLLPLCIL